MRILLSVLILITTLSTPQLWGQIDNPPPPPPPPPPEVTEDQVFKLVEEMPRFPGCEDYEAREQKERCARQKMLEYIYKHLEYPEEAVLQKQEGTAVVSFIVEKDGAISNVEAVKDPGAGMGAAAVAAVETMNEQNIKWIPGRGGRRGVRVQLNLPIHFRLDAAELPANLETPPPPTAEPVEEEPVFVDLEVVEELDETIYALAEVMPRFYHEDCEARPTRDLREACAQEKMLRFIYDNLQYPEEAEDVGMEGMGVVRFVVEGDGSLSNIELTRDIGFGCGEEVLRLVEMMDDPGQWVPGQHQRKTVRVVFNLPIRFKIPD